MKTFGGLYTDLYELTMAQGYFLEGRHEQPAVFDYFFRSNPYGGGYTIFAGLQDMLEAVEGWFYNSIEIDYLRSIGFKPDFLNHLADFSFRGSMHAVQEGEVVFPNAPVVRVEGSILETQLVETLLLNYLNFQSLIATKASRIRSVAGDRTVADFGLRRAQATGGIQASRAAVIGGADSTSNVHAARLYGLKATGTMAHSWVQSFDDELQAFRAFASRYPDTCILLVDTYDTLHSGLPNAMIVARELAAAGKRLAGIRLDSGDLAYLSKRARELLDREGFPYIKIFASNQLDEHVIRSLNEQEAPIDGFGVGTELVTGKPSAALDGVYKLSMYNHSPTLKISENIEKVTLPGVKKTLRLIDAEGLFAGDAIALSSENTIHRIYHPHRPGKSTDVSGYHTEDLMQLVMHGGANCCPERSVADIAGYARDRLSRLPSGHRRFENPHTYKVGISERLMTMRDNLVDELKARQHVEK